MGRNLGLDMVTAINTPAIAGLVPDLVVVLDLDSHRTRARRAPDSDRFETAGDEFAVRVAAAYRDLAPQMGWEIIDAGGDPDAVADSLWNLVLESLTP